VTSWYLAVIIAALLVFALVVFWGARYFAQQKIRDAGMMSSIDDGGATGAALGAN
jgi:hypothetical protein